MDYLKTNLLDTFTLSMDDPGIKVWDIFSLIINHSGITYRISGASITDNSGIHLGDTLTIVH